MKIYKKLKATAKKSKYSPIVERRVAGGTFNDAQRMQATP